MDHWVSQIERLLLSYLLVLYSLLLVLSFHPTTLSAGHKLLHHLILVSGSKVVTHCVPTSLHLVASYLRDTGSLLVLALPHYRSPMCSPLVDNERATIVAFKKSTAIFPSGSQIDTSGVPI